MSRKNIDNNGKRRENDSQAYILYQTRDYIEIFRHQQPYVADMVIEILREHHIPCYMQEGAITGILLAAVFPAAYPGREYVVFAPKKLYDDVLPIIENVPVDRELLNVKWRTSPDIKRQIRLIIFWLIILGIPALTWLLGFFVPTFSK